MTSGNRSFFDAQQKQLNLGRKRQRKFGPKIREKIAQQWILPLPEKNSGRKPVWNAVFSFLLC